MSDSESIPLCFNPCTLLQCRTSQTKNMHCLYIGCGTTLWFMTAELFWTHPVQWVLPHFDERIHRHHTPFTRDVVGILAPPPRSIYTTVYLTQLHPWTAKVPGTLYNVTYSSQKYRRHDYYTTCYTTVIQHKHHVSVMVHPSMTYLSGHMPGTIPCDAIFVSSW